MKCYLEGILSSADIVNLRPESVVHVITSLLNIRTLGSDSEPGGGDLEGSILAAEGFPQLVERVLHAGDLLVGLLQLGVEAGLGFRELLEAETEHSSDKL